jgi:hypothetical protein
VASWTYATGSFPSAPVGADFNGDKKLDLAVVNGNAGTISIPLGNGDGTFQTRTDYAVGQAPVGIVVADFNRDGHVDLVVAAATNFGAYNLLVSVPVITTARKRSSVTSMATESPTSRLPPLTGLLFLQATEMARLGYKSAPILDFQFQAL